MAHAFRARAWLAVNVYAFSISFHTSALMTVVVPAALRSLAGGRHTQLLGLLAAASSFVSMVVPVVTGYASDAVKARGGSRRPFILAGGLLNALGLFAMYASPQLALWIGAFFVSFLGQGITSAGYQALWSDVVPAEARGVAAGGQGAATLLGNIGGLVLAGILGPRTVILWMALAMLCGMAVTLYVREPRAAHGATAADPPAKRARRPRDRDFIRVFLSQAFVTFGMTLLMTFVMYYFSDVLRVRNPVASTSGVATLALAGAVAASVGMGRLSDRVPRRWVVAGSCLPMAFAAAGFAFLQRPAWLYVFAVSFGLGYGAFLSTGWALTVDVLPDRRRTARDLGVWGVASTLPAVIAPMVGSWLLGLFARPATGYQALFVLAGLSLAAGGAAALRVGRPAGHPWSLVALRLLIASIIRAAVTALCRVRVEGRLPRRRGSTLVVANHLHDFDGMILPAWLTFGGPWRKPVYFAASQRLFEPGFLAVRFPGLARWLCGINLRGLFWRVGVRPIENQPLSRPLASYADEVRRTAGDLPLGKVFTPDAVARLGLPEDAPLSAVWRYPAFVRAQAPASLVDLREPYRSAVRRAARSQISAQLAELIRLVEAGGTLFLTPEGRYSPDGYVHRFRMAFGPLFARAEHHFIAALTYDPFAFRRLGVWVRILSVPRGADLLRMLRASRPVTPSQVVLHVLLRPDGSGPGGTSARMTASDIAAGVARYIAQLPPTVSVVPELRRGLQRTVRRTLRGMVRRGILVREGDVYRLGPVHTDPRFPHVPDISAWLLQALQDTVQAASAGGREAGEPAEEEGIRRG
ncbi:hypothetical protein GCM10010885_22260 [Alicyclobacillus cellulosilyticus]|uniref:Major facilitator superfamily (MFS) profile domain-containing protein n=1 Tax=Alicyclobacillus cellulosilyticus TaxID=1003997 RepID=A0A917NN20_9BACL|nr:MFS transporter [Alicyclobacillus cellulosilyticus]GGJ12428.1 hypothetical protein GCM10010885_22260 [Alicyclobacillus cellulosilyticus]